MKRLLGLTQLTLAATFGAAYLLVQFFRHAKLQSE